VGPKEAESRSIALRDRISGELGTMSVDQVLEFLGTEVRERRIRQVAENKLAEPEAPQPETTSNEY
ncbi:MAG: threonine--tRNA ligase, partial [Pirellula sp.]